MLVVIEMKFGMLYVVVVCVDECSYYDLEWGNVIDLWGELWIVIDFGFEVDLNVV